MNQVLREGASTADGGLMLGITTIAFMMVFLGYALWVLSSRSRAELDAAAQLPLEDD